MACRADQRARRKEAHGDEDRAYAKDYLELNGDRLNAQRREEYQNDNKVRLRYILGAAKARARIRDVPFDLTIDTLPTIPDRCPALGITMVLGGPVRESTPTLDRIEPSKGYVPGNVQWLSHRANRIKSDATVEELEAIANLLRSLQHD